MAQLRSHAPDRAAAEAPLPPGVWPNASCLVTGESLPPVRTHLQTLFFLPFGPPQDGLGWAGLALSLLWPTRRRPGRLRTRASSRG